MPLILLAFVGVVALSCLVGVALCYLGSVAHGWTRRGRDKARREGEEHVRSLVRQAAWWFSEDPATRKAIQDLAAGVEPDTARERWRWARRPAAVPRMLDQYEAGNIRWLLREIMDDPEWSAAFNTGDWIGQVLHRLEDAGENQANAARGDARRRLATHRG